MNIPIAVFVFLMLSGHGRKIDWKENLKGVVLLKLGAPKKEAAKLNKKPEKPVAKAANDKVGSDIREKNDNQITNSEIRHEFGLPKDEQIVELSMDRYLPKNKK